MIEQAQQLVPEDDEHFPLRWKSVDEAPNWMSHSARKYEAAISELQTKASFVEGQLRAMEQLVRDADSHRASTEQAATLRIGALDSQLQAKEAELLKLNKTIYVLSNFITKLRSKIIMKWRARYLTESWRRWRRHSDGTKTHEASRRPIRLTACAGLQPLPCGLQPPALWPAAPPCGLPCRF